MLMKSLVVYFSRSGTTKKLAEAIAKELRADIEQLFDVKPKKGLFGYLAYGRDAMKGMPAQLKMTVKDPKEYDIVIIGTPVWAGTVCSPVRAYLLQNKGLSKVAFFCTSSSPGPQRTFDQMLRLSRPPVAELALRRPEVKSNKHLEKVKQFAAKLGQPEPADDGLKKEVSQEKFAPKRPSLSKDSGKAKKA